MPRTCIYCRQQSGPFRSVEHVVPESLGNETLVLAAGVVCDPCNNGPLALLDGQLVGFEPVAMLRAVRGVPGKKGRHKAFRLPGLEVRRDKSGGVTVRYVVPDDAPAGGTPASIEGTGTQRMDEHLAGGLARALLKQMLGGMYRDFGRKFVLQPQFDGLRATIVGREPYSGLLAIGRRVDMDAFERGHGGFSYNFVGGAAIPPMWVEGRYFGLSLCATWGKACRDLDRSSIPGAVADRFSLIEVDPEFGVR